MTGEVVGQYKILEKLGEGGMGAVYKGLDTMVEREVAIKVLRPEIARQPELVERFRTEAITLAKLNSPGIATLFNFFRQGDDYFMVMEFVAGHTLDQVIREGGAMSWERAVSLCCHILECIQPAHNAGILHRDIKPANIMLTPWGGIKVMDFGIARVLGTSRTTREGLMVGTLEYIAPERVTGQEADARADLYSLGVVLYELISGRLPFDNTSEFAIMRGHVQDTPPPFARFTSNVPPAVEAVVMKSLAKAPGDRFQSCAEFINALQSAARFSLPAGQAISTVDKAFDFDRLKPTTFLAQPTGFSTSTDAMPTVAVEVPTVFVPQAQPAPKKSFLMPAVVGAAVLSLLGGYFVFRGRPQPNIPQTQVSNVPVVTPAGTAPTLRMPPPVAQVRPSPAGPDVQPPAVNALSKPEAAAPVEAPPQAPPPSTVSEPGVYEKRGDQWVQLVPEAVTWKKAGMIKKSLVGSFTGAGSPNAAPNPASFLIVTPDGVAVTDYSLVLIRKKKGAREIRVTGDGPDPKTLLPFTAKRLGGRNYQVEFSQGEGEYVFLPPRTETAGAVPSPQKVYTFRVE